jgi:hypothetical protein
VVTVSWRRHSPTPLVDLAGSSGGAATLASATAWPCCREIFARIRHVQSKYSVLLLHGCARSRISRIRTYQVDSDVTGSLGLTTVTDSANGSPWAGLGLAGGKPGACPRQARLGASPSSLGASPSIQPGRACMAARLAMTLQSGEWGRSGHEMRAQSGHPSRIRLSGRQNSSSKRRGQASAAGRGDSACSDPAGPDGTE